MSLIGQQIKGSSGKRYTVLSKLGEPTGQGDCYVAETPDRTRWFVKVFYASSDQRVIRRRTTYLIGLDLHKQSPALVAPQDCFEIGGRVAHAALFFEGDELQTYFSSSSPPPLLAMLQAAVAVAKGYRILEEQCGIAHADTSATNARGSYDGEVFRVGLIDFDNFRALNDPSIPPPPCVGQYFYLAPEQIVAMQRGTPAPVDLFTERFAIGTLLHELLLLRHPAQSVLTDATRYADCVKRGVWLGDPILRRDTDTCGGYPVGVLSAPLAALLRAALGENREARPSARIWEAALVQASDSIFECPDCQGPTIIDSGKQTCPYCRQAYPILGLRMPNGNVIPILAASRVVGRADLGGAAAVSSCHLIVQRRGPESFIVCHGSHGTFRHVDGKWQRLAAATPLPVDVGDRIRLADSVELVMVRL